MCEADISRIVRYTVVRPWKEGGGGGPSIPNLFKYFEKYPISLKEIWQISAKFSKHCIPISLKEMESILKIA